MALLKQSERTLFAPRPPAGGGRLPRAGLRRLRAVALLCLVFAAPECFALKLKVDIQGLEGEYLKNVQALLAVYQERETPELDAARLRALHRAAPEEIRDALAPFGLYRVEVQDSLAEPATPDGTWQATYRVDPGPPIKIASVDYRVTGPGADNPAFPERFPMQPGDVLLHAQYEKAKSEIRYAATGEGYLDADLATHRVLIDPVAYEARIEFHVATGPRYFLGDVRFKQDLLNDDLLRRYVRYKPGDVYDPDVLVNLQARLLGTEYFDSVEIVPLKEPGSDTVPIEVVATRNKANKFRVGVGYATDVGPRFSMDWRRRYWNRWGHKSRAQLTLSPGFSQLDIDYRIPIRDPTRDYITIRPNVTNYDTASAKGWIAAVQFARSVVTPGGWRRTFGIDYQFEDYSLNEADSDAVNEFVPYITWARTVTDDPVYTKKGYRIKTGVLGSSTALLAPTNYLSLYLDAKWVRAFWERWRFITRTDLGITFADSVDDLPASRRYYAGGDNSIRGWGFDALGPNQPITDETVGGRYLAVGSLELERELWGNWSAAVFTDFGNAFDPDYEQEYEQSVGTGLRWRSPIGQIRLDVAFALTKDRGEDEGGFPPTRLHLVIGPDL